MKCKSAESIIFLCNKNRGLKVGSSMWLKFAKEISALEFVIKNNELEDLIRKPRHTVFYAFESTKLQR